MDKDRIIGGTEEGSDAVEAGGSRLGGRLRGLVRWLPLLVLILSGIAVSILGFSDRLSMSSIIESRTELLDFVSERPLTTLAIYAAIYVAAVVMSVPGGSLLTIVGGILFGGIVGGLVTTAAAVIGSVLVFLIARTALAGWMRRRVARMGRRATSFAEGFRTNAFYVIVVIRLIPVMPYWASNALPALFGVRLWVFTLATLIGLLPWTVSFAFFGEALDEIVVAQELADPGCAAAGTCTLDFSTLTSGPVITGLIIALVALIPVLVHWWSRGRKQAETGPGA
jgi:uncharacterized membrane protein YdjX (TVP38/TMEM64 family)